MAEAGQSLNPDRGLGAHLIGVLQTKDPLLPQAVEAAGRLAQHAQAQVNLLRRAARLGVQAQRVARAVAHEGIDILADPAAADAIHGGVPQSRSGRRSGVRIPAGFYGLDGSASTFKPPRETPREPAGELLCRRLPSCGRLKWAYYSLRRTTRACGCWHRARRTPAPGGNHVRTIPAA